MLGAMGPSEKTENSVCIRTLSNIEVVTGSVLLNCYAFTFEFASADASDIFRQHRGLLTTMLADIVVRERYVVDGRNRVVPTANVTMLTVNIPLQENE